MNIILDDWVKRIRHYMPKNLGKILEVGSLNVNGTIRDSFKEDEYESYMGIDMRAGKDVDMVVNSHELVRTFGKDSFDLVLSIATMEHDDRFWLTRKAINTVLKRNGFYILSVPSINFHYHPYPHDYWRFTKPAVLSVMFEGYEVLDLADVGGNIICAIGKRL